MIEYFFPTPCRLVLHSKDFDDCVAFLSADADAEADADADAKILFDKS